MRPPDIQYKIVHINISPVRIEYIRYVCLLFTPLIIQGILTRHFSGTYILGECMSLQDNHTCKINRTMTARDMGDFTVLFGI